MVAGKLAKTFVFVCCVTALFQSPAISGARAEPDLGGVWLPDIRDQRRQEIANMPPWKPEIPEQIKFSSAVLVDLRIFRQFERDQPPREVTRRFLPSIWPLLVILLVTGSLLIIGEPRRSLVNSTFYTKMALLLFAIMLTATRARAGCAVDFYAKKLARCRRQGRGGP